MEFPMEIGLIYSSKDPRQKKTRAFLKRFVRERGILAHFTEAEKPVEAPIITINGCAVTGTTPPTKTKDKNTISLIPSTKDLTRALEKSIWCL